MNNTIPLSELERTQQFQYERYSDGGLTCHDDGFRRTEIFADYPPGPSQSLTPVVLQSATENPSLSTATTDEFTERRSAEMLSESDHQLSDLFTLEPAIPSLDQSRMEAEEEEAETDFLPPVEVKIEGEEQPETPGLEEMIDLSSFTDGIYICEVKYFPSFIPKYFQSVKYF